MCLEDFSWLFYIYHTVVFSNAPQGMLKTLKVILCFSYKVPTLTTKPNTLIVHIGTNDLRNNTPSKLLNSLEDLGEMIMQYTNKNTYLIWSEIITRADDPTLTNKVNLVYNSLARLFETRNWGLIKNNNITGNLLNNSGLHLNKQGTTALAKNIKQCLISHHNIWLTNDLPTSVDDANISSSNISISAQIRTRSYTQPRRQTNNPSYRKLKCFKIGHLNIASLFKHIEALRIFMQNQTFDVLSINETRLDNTISNDEVKITGYDLIRKDRNRNGGGVAIYVRRTIPYTDRNYLLTIMLKQFVLKLTNQKVKLW